MTQSDRSEALKRYWAKVRKLSKETGKDIATIRKELRDAPKDKGPAKEERSTANPNRKKTQKKRSAATGPKARPKTRKRKPKVKSNRRFNTPIPNEFDRDGNKVWRAPNGQKISARRAIRSNRLKEYWIMVKFISQKTGRPVSDVRSKLKGLTVLEMRGQFRGFDSEGRVVYSAPSFEASRIFDEEFGFSPAFDWTEVFRDVAS